MSSYYNRLRKFEFTDILGWSYSRYNTFQQCKRKYYYEYYRKRDIENVAKIAHLKDLTTVPLEIGNISHKLIQALLSRLQKSAEEIDREKFYDYARRLTFDVCKEKNFEDVYYGKRDAIDFETEIFQPVAVAMKNFLLSDRLQWLFEEALVSKEDWIIEFEENNRFGECRIDNQKAYCKVDFLFPVEGRLNIIDWKTGKEDYAKHSIQLRGYAGWANFQFGADLSAITTTVAYLLPEYKETTV
ncbi:MAG: PD-(D/E)XK nuclease family protein, partial [Acidobacteriota bacterium]